MPPRRNAASPRRSPAKDEAEPTSAPTSDPLPCGKSVVPALCAADATPKALQGLDILVVVASLCFLPFTAPTLVALGADGTWDTAHNIDGLAHMIRAALSVSQAAVLTSACGTAAAFGTLLLCDILSECMPSIKWPPSWQCDNTLCYDEMFCEPMRAAPALVRRPGNTYSNCVYLFAALLAFASISTSPFALADASAPSHLEPETLPRAVLSAPAACCCDLRSQGLRLGRC